MEYQDKLGCYRVGDLKFYSKLEAIECMQKTGIHPHWDFNESVFSSYDWTIEPAENILELYRQRAQQLREKYDYIVLFWSGGADSETVLQSFIFNDIKLDEIVSYSNYEASRVKTDYMNSELFFRTIPRAEELKNQYPWMKFRNIDMSQMTLDFFKDPDHKFDWIYNMNMFFTPNAAARDKIALKIKDWADIIYSGKKLCLLWGADKPRVYHENNKFLFKFIDIIDFGPKVSGMAGSDPYHDELFYWTPDCAKIVIKQAHLIKNYLNTCLETSIYISETKSDLAFKIKNGRKWWLSNHGVHKIIYPNWDIDTFDAGKPGSLIMSPRDSWFFNLEQDNTAKKIWTMGTDRLWDLVPKYWKNDPNDMYKGLKACWSKDYYLEKQ